MERADDEDMINKAQQLWTMLDDMAENDPAAYNKFVTKHIQEGKDFLAPPAPHMCVLVTLHCHPPKKLYINFCSWKRIKYPASPNDLIPVLGTHIVYEKDEYALISIAFNPKVLDESGRNAENPADRDALIQLALNFVESHQQVKVSRTYTILPQDTRFKGNLDNIHQLFKKLSVGDEAIPGSPHQDLESDLKFKNHCLEQLHLLAPFPEDKSRPGSAKGTNANGASRSKLIEEILEPKLATPTYSLETNECGGGRQLVLKVNLPNMKSVSQCDLDISEDDVNIFVPELYKLNVKLPSSINEDLSKAKFCKSTSILTVNMPYKS